MWHKGGFPFRLILVASLPENGLFLMSGQPPSRLIFSMAISRMRNFCSLPVTVIGKSLTNQIVFGIFKWAS
jgi:hypothetical protein